MSRPLSKSCLRMLKAVAVAEARNGRACTTNLHHAARSPMVTLAALERRGLVVATPQEDPPLPYARCWTLTDAGRAALSVDLVRP